VVIQRVRGLSLFELLATLVILSILVSLAAPSFSRMLAEQRLRQVGTELRVSLSSARSEAVKRNEGVSLIQQGSDWSNGWCIEPSTETSCSSQPIQQFTIPVEQVKLTLAGVSGGTALQFNAWGRVTSCPTFTLTTSAAGSACTLCLTVSMDGRVQSHTGDCPSDCDQEGEEMSWAGACS